MLTKEAQIPDKNKIREAQKRMWGCGNFARISSKQVIVAEHLCETLDLHGGRQVLDVATGHGNTALAAARRDCIVVAIDTVHSLMDIGRERARAERLEIDFHEGDAEHIPYPDESFDYVLSSFGVQFTPDQRRTAMELLRVCRRRGKIGLVNWTATGFMQEFNEVLSKYITLPAVPSPYLWGEKGALTDFFGDSVTKLKINPRTFVYRFKSIDSWQECFQRTYSPFLLALESQHYDKREQMIRDLSTVVRRYNRSGDATLILPLDYVEVIAERC